MRKILSQCKQSQPCRLWFPVWDPSELNTSWNSSSSLTCRGQTQGPPANFSTLPASQQVQSATCWGGSRNQVRMSVSSHGVLQGSHGFHCSFLHSLFTITTHDGSALRSTSEVAQLMSHRQMENRRPTLIHSVLLHTVFGSNDRVAVFSS